MSALVWLTWRQHRWSIIGVTALALVAGYTLIVTQGGQAGSIVLAAFYGLMGQLAFGAVVGMFLGAPLIARELEERTYFVAWGQDVTPVRWLRGKALVLGALALALGAVVGAGDGFGGVQETWGVFEASPLVQAGYALFGFALGVFIGLLTRHVVTAMAATLVFYAAVRAVLSVLVRDHYWPAERVVARWDGKAVLPQGALELGRGFVDRNLRPVDVPEECEMFMPNPGSCMETSGRAVGTYVEYQPIERVGLFQFFEFGLFTLLAAVLFVLTFRLLRQGGGWKPSRSHRRITPQSAESVSEPAAAQG